MADYRKGDILMDIRRLTKSYLDTYSTSDGVLDEHDIDAAAVLTAFMNEPQFLNYLKMVASRGTLAALDVGAGEAAKSIRIAAGLVTLLELDSFVLHVNEPDPTQLGRIRNEYGSEIQIKTYPQTYESLVADVSAGRIVLDPPPVYATSLHMAYYLPQVNGAIPSLAELVQLVDPNGLCVYIIEGPGQLQAMKKFMQSACGLGTPASQAMILKTLSLAGIPYRNPIVIPNTAWSVDLSKAPGQMFADDFAFLLDGNWGSRPPTARDFRIAGTWVQRNAHPGPDGAFLNGPDSLILAGLWLESNQRPNR